MEYISQMSQPSVIVPAIFSSILPATPVIAGMPSLTLTDVAGARLDAISFFLLLMFLSALLLRWSWNVLATQFPRFPQLGFKQAVGLIFVSGLFLYVVLTMISGARELMTPGAWSKNGLTYQLAMPERDTKTWLAIARQTALEQLRDALWLYAKDHNGELPLSRESGEVRTELWSGVHPQKVPLAYVPGVKPGVGVRIVVYEPDDYGASRFALLADGSIAKLAPDELASRLITEASYALMHE